jgi:hypothetical protein
VGNWLRPAHVDDGLVTKKLAYASHLVEQRLSRRVLVELTTLESMGFRDVHGLHAMPECWKSFGGECPCSQARMPQNWLYRSLGGS